MFKRLLFVLSFMQVVLLFGQGGSSKPTSATEIDNLCNQANELFEKGKVNEALALSKNIIKKGKEINYTKGLSRAYLQTANYYYELSKPYEGSQYIFLAEQTAHDDPELMIKIYFVKALILIQAHSYDEAEKKLRKVIDYAGKIKNKTEAKKYIDRSNINIGNINFLLEKYDVALSNYHKNFNSLDTVHKVGTSINIAEIYLLTNKIDSARVYLNIAEENIRFINEKRIYLNVKAGLQGIQGLYYLKAKEYDKAIRILKKDSATTTLYTSDELLGMAYAKLHKTDSATYFFEKSLNTKFNNRLDNEKVYDASSLIYNEEKLDIRKNYEQKRKQYLLLIVITSISVLLLIYILYNHRKQARRKAEFLESEKEKLKIEKELSELKQEHFQKQVLATSIQLDQKNKFLDELKDNMKNNKDFNLTTYLKNNQLIDKDFNNFHDIVKDVHPNFFKKIDDIAVSKLTNLDIKYAAYIYLNMDNTQIAAVLNVDPKTVSVTKYRLKQKLGLDKDVDLNTFIRNLT